MNAELLLKSKSQTRCLYWGQVDSKVVELHPAPAGGKGRRLQDLREGLDDLLHLRRRTVAQTCLLVILVSLDPSLAGIQPDPCSSLQTKEPFNN